jgi:hypothetical protein
LQKQEAQKPPKGGFYRLSAGSLIKRYNQGSLATAEPGRAQYIFGGRSWLRMRL